MIQEVRLTRRELMKLGGFPAVGAALPGEAAAVFAHGAQRLLSTTRIAWIQAQSCSWSKALFPWTCPRPV